MRRTALLLALLTPALVLADATEDSGVYAQRVVPATPRAAKAIENGLSYLGEPYLWNGRDTQRLPGLDCLGLLYRAWGPVTDTAWTAYPVNPSELVAGGLLGEPVKGTPALRRGFDVNTLRPGDVLYFLIEGYEIPDEPLWVRGEARFWPWHTALYIGDGEILHAAPGDKVRRQALDEILWDALLATRP